MKITLQAMVNPYTYEDVDTILKIGNAALDKGHEVSIFLFCDSAIASNSKIKPVRGDRRIPDMLKEIINRGAKVDICGICMDYRGITKDMIVEGSNPSGLPELAELIYNTDRFISLMA